MNVRTKRRTWDELKREGWHGHCERESIDRFGKPYNRLSVQECEVVDLAVADEREQAYQRDVMGWSENIISGEYFWGYFTKQPTNRKRLPFSPELKDQIWMKTGGFCSYCGIPLMPFTNFTIDHIVPVSAGGSDEYVNLTPCCKRCNSRKSAMDVDVFRERCGVGLFWIERNGGHYDPCP